MNSNKTQGEYVKIKQIGINKIPDDSDKVLIFNRKEKSLSFRYEGGTEHTDASISSNDVFKDGLFNKYVILRRLTKWEILDFIVYDFISGFYDNCEHEIDLLINSKSKEECLYMQKSSNYAIERFLPIKMLYVIFGIAIGQISEASAYAMLFIFLFGVFVYYTYHNHRKRYHQILLKLEANIHK